MGRNELVAFSRGSIASDIHAVPWSISRGELFVPVFLNRLTTLKALSCVVSQPTHPVCQQLTASSQICRGNQVLGGREKAGKSAPACISPASASRDIGCSSVEAVDDAQANRVDRAFANRDETRCGGVGHREDGLCSAGAETFVGRPPHLPSGHTTISAMREPGGPSYAFAYQILSDELGQCRRREMSVVGEIPPSGRVRRQYPSASPHAIGVTLGLGRPTR